MYDLPYFKEPNEKVVLEFIANNPFAVLSGVDENGSPVATQIPLFLENENSKQFLRGHMMRNTDHHKAMLKNENVLAVFNGPNCYVSATWYKEPHQASTWNYMSVYIHGRISFCDEAALKKILRKTSLHFENGKLESSTVFDNLPDRYLMPLMNAIVAFEIEVESVENVFKLSQNRDRESYMNIINKLKEGEYNEKKIAEAMEVRFTGLFEEK